MELILASASPRRAALLRTAGFAFRVEPAGVAETRLPGETPGACVKRLSLEKARAVNVRFPGCAVLAADTEVALDGECLGKPGSAAEAERMLAALSGRSHEVLTGFTLLANGEESTGLCATRVVFRDLEPEEIADYVRTGEPMDKAGGYGIQAGAAHMVERIEGSYTNVVGLPMAEVSALLRPVLG